MKYLLINYSLPNSNTIVLKLSSKMKVQIYKRSFTSKTEQETQRLGLKDGKTKDMWTFKQDTVPQHRRTHKLPKEIT